MIIVPLAVAALWVGTHFSFGWEREAPAPGIANAALADIEERQRAPGSRIDYRRIDARLQALAAQDDMVGIAVGIVEDGEIRFLKGYGVTLSGTNDRVHPGTVFRWASLSKGAAADMIALLASENRLALNEPVSRYAPTLRLPGASEHKATLEDLLSHRLGLFSHASDDKLEADVSPALLRQMLGTLNAICPPGTCHAYQNVAYDAASEIVSKVTGKPYGEVLRERFFGPLGMETASVSRAGLMGARSWARPHVGGGSSRPVEVAEAYYRVPAAGGVNSSIKDLAVWMQAQMGLAPQILSPAVLAEVQRPRAATPREYGRLRRFRERVTRAGYGLGWRTYDYAGHRVIAHRGGVRGYRSLIMFDPELRTGVVAMWNASTSQPGGLEFEVMDMAYGLPASDWLLLATAPPPTRCPT